MLEPRGTVSKPSQNLNLTNGTYFSHRWLEIRLAFDKFKFQTVSYEEFINLEFALQGRNVVLKFAHFEIYIIHNLNIEWL